MSDNNGFVDLRVGQGANGGSEDSVWPSFTDVMTVIVMIFLMALVVIMIRNSELDIELDITKNEQAAVSDENQELLHRLSSLKDQLALLENSLDESSKQNQSLRGNLDEEQRRFQALSLEQESIKRELSQLLGEWTELTELKKSLLIQTESVRNKFADENQGPLTINQAIALIMANNIKLENEKKAALDELEGLNASYAALTEELASVRKETAVLSDSEATLEEEIQIANNKIEYLQNREKTLSEQVVVLQRELTNNSTQSKSRISTLRRENKELKASLNSFTQQLADTGVLLESLKKEKISLSAQLADVDATRLRKTEQLEVANRQVLAISELFEKTEEEKGYLASAGQLSEEKLRALREEYQSLEEKYRTLIRPSRSKLGKYVVEVILISDESGDKLSYQYRLPGGELVDVPEKAELNKRLQALKDTYGDNLYTQVIIPTSSDISHSEA